MAEVPPAPAVDSWVDNPNVCNINPGTKSGQAIFEKKTKGFKKQNVLTAPKKDAQASCYFLEQKAPALGKVFTRIPITYDAVRDPTKWGNLLCGYSSISMNFLQREAQKSFRNPVATVDQLSVAPFTVKTLHPANVDVYKKLFYSWVDVQVVTELIKNILTDAEYSKLMIKTNTFTFQDDTKSSEIFNGPCILKLLFDRINQYVVVGVEVLFHKLEATKFYPYLNDFDGMLTDMEESYLKIIKNKSNCESNYQYMMKALLSGTNTKFNAFIQQIKYDIDSGIRLNNHMPRDDLATETCVKYNNMVASNEYSKIDPKDAKILAITTKVTSL